MASTDQRKNKRKLPRNVSAFVDRHGKERFRYRKTGQQTRYFESAFGTKDFDAELEAFRAGETITVQRYPHGSVGWLAARYRVSMAFRSGKGPQREKEAWAIIEKFVAQFAKDRVADFRFDHVEAIFAAAMVKRVEDGRARGGPSAAHNLRRELLPLFKYAVKLGLIHSNPVEIADAPTVPRSKGFHSWTEPEIAQYRARWPLGTMARLALEIFLWTALRRGDASTFGRQHLKAGRIAVETSKNGATAWLPAAPQLIEAIEAMPVTGTGTFLVTHYGKPFTVAGLGGKMREWCDAAGLPHCSAHGLRKAAARRAAESGATQPQLKAIGQWSGDKEVATYIRDANQERLAAAALNPVIEADLANRAKSVSQSND